jgi:hypothetical protein
MRVLKSSKPIPVLYLKQGKDKGAYDQEVKIWLPGRTTPVARPDTRGFSKRGQRDAGIAPPSPPAGKTALLVPPRVAAQRRGENVPSQKLEVVRR